MTEIVRWMVAQPVAALMLAVVLACVILYVRWLSRHD